MGKPPSFDRREATAALLCYLASTHVARALPPTQRALPDAMAPLLDELERRTFRWFADLTSKKNGLVPDRWPSKSFASIAAVGFNLTALPIGVERGWMTRAEAAERTLTTLRFFWKAPQGPEPTGMTGYKGFFYHFLDMEHGTRFEQVELSTIDTALFLGGTLFASRYFDKNNAVEHEIRMLADSLYSRVDWRWAQANAPFISLGWTPEHGFIRYDWQGYNEAMILYILALGSPSFAVAPDAWAAWCRSYSHSWSVYHGIEHLGFPPLFGHQYSHVWIDFRSIADAFMRAKGIDYFENSRRATLAQRQYAIANPLGWKGYGADLWGLSACDGPTDEVHDYRGERRTFRGYAARGMGGLETYDDGTIAPTAALSSIAFAPTEVLSALQAMHDRYGSEIYGEYGFVDAFNPSFDFADAKLERGKITTVAGWVDSDYLGIDQGPILAGIENFRSGLVWRLMRGHPAIRRGLKRAGFTGGWLA